MSVQINDKRKNVELISASDMHNGQFGIIKESTLPECYKDSLVLARYNYLLAIDKEYVWLNRSQLTIQVKPVDIEIHYR